VKQAAYAKALAWLKTKPSLDELSAKYPDEWATVQQEMSAIVARGDAEELKAYLERSSVSAPGQRQQTLQETLSRYVRSQMAHQSIKKLSVASLAASVGAKQGKLRFNLFNGFIAQKLLFARALERKPVSLSWFRFFWPLVWQRKRLMPLVQPRGIYCFYSRELITALAAMIGSRSCLEIGAGDGTLTRFLQKQGVQVTATDNYSWSQAVKYPEWVIKLDAREALRNYLPEVVICSWPPSQNDFERDVFATPCVQLYIVIGSRHAFAFGNWQDYKHQTTFDLEEDKVLGNMLVPPELESAVYVFRRKAGK